MVSTQKSLTKILANMPLDNIVGLNYARENHSLVIGYDKTFSIRCYNTCVELYHHNSLKSYYLSIENVLGKLSIRERIEKIFTYISEAITSLKRDKPFYYFILFKGMQCLGKSKQLWAEIYIPKVVEWWQDGVKQKTIIQNSEAFVIDRTRYKTTPPQPDTDNNPNNFNQQIYPNTVDKRLFSTYFKKLQGLFLSQPELAKTVLSMPIKFPATNKTLLDLITRSQATIQPKYINYVKSDYHYSELSFSPERVLKKQNRDLCIDYIAGTCAAEDEGADDRLIHQQRFKNEYHLGLANLMDSIKYCCDNIRYNEQPKIIRSGNLKHLYGNILAKSKNISISKLISNIYPNGAICGVPVQNAYDNISEIEKINRYNYSGLIGFMSSDNNLISLFLNIRTLSLFETAVVIQVGAGITRFSEQKLEFEELKLKLAKFKELIL